MSQQIIQLSQIVVKEPKGREKFDFYVKEGITLTLILKITESTEMQLNVHLNGKGARAIIVGIILGKNNEKINLETQQIHEAPETTSNLLIKSVLRGSSEFNYHGGIRVEKLAQKTDAYQRNENLLLSNQAKAKSEPALEILANDVRCTHGATVSSLNDEQLWYLTSRGITKAKAEQILVQGFLRSAFDLVDVTDRDQLLQQLDL